MPTTGATPVVMFHLGRSGSTVLCDLLGRHPDVTWDKEPFLEVRKMGRSHPLLRPRPVRWLVSWLPPEEPLSFIRERRRRARTRFHGIDVKPFHLSRLRLSFEQFLAETERDGPTPAYVVLARRNTLRKVVSSLMMRRTGRTHLKRAPTEPLSPIRIAVERLELDGETWPLVDFLAHLDRTLHDLDAALANRNLLRLVYEDDLETDPIAGYRRACAHLGVEAVPLEARFARTTARPPCQLIENVADVRRALTGTPYGWMLDS